MVVLRGKAHYKCGHSAQYSGLKLATSTFVLSLPEFILKLHPTSIALLHDLEKLLHCFIITVKPRLSGLIGTSVKIVRIIENMNINEMQMEIKDI